MKYLYVDHWWDFTDGRKHEYRWNVSLLKPSGLVAPRYNMSTDAEYNNNNNNNIIIIIIIINNNIVLIS